jgi:hypothetical protein
MRTSPRLLSGIWIGLAASVALTTPASAQLVDRTRAPNAANEGINKSFGQQVGAGRGTVNTPGSSAFIIARDPFRAVRRGRQLFQRKFTLEQGHGPLTGDGAGDVGRELIIGAGLADSCAACHASPRGSAGAGGDVVTRPDSRNAPHLFGLGIKEMIADEITTELRNIRSLVVNEARSRRRTVRASLSVRQGINYGFISANSNGVVDTSEVVGVDHDLRVRPFFLHGETISIREFLVGAFNAEMGLESFDPDLLAASRGSRRVTPSGMVLDGALDTIEAPPATSVFDDPDRDGIDNEIPESIVDFVEFYLLNYFKPGLGAQNSSTSAGRSIFGQIGCASCHRPDFVIARDRRVADLNTVFDPNRGIFNRLFATATPLFQEVSDGTSHPRQKLPLRGNFTVRNIFTDFKRHDLGPRFHERNYDGTIRTHFLTPALWGVGTTAPYGHDGRSIDLTEVILRHGGEAQSSRNSFASLSFTNRIHVLNFLNSLILFPPDDTASTLNPGNPSTPGFPQFGHGSIALTVLFNDPTDVE